MMETEGVMRQACASCKHQRKKCQPNCILARYFPAEKSQKFQAVHKVFGVSNVQKMIQSLDTDEERSKAAESLIWEAECRLHDPVNGCWAEYKKLQDELYLLKQQVSKSIGCNNSNHEQKPCLWTTIHNNSKLVGLDGIGMTNTNNNMISYINGNSNVILEQSPYIAHLQGIDKGGHICPPINGHNQYYYFPDEFNTSM